MPALRDAADLDPKSNCVGYADLLERDEAKAASAAAQPAVKAAASTEDPESPEAEPAPKASPFKRNLKAASDNAGESAEEALKEPATTSRSIFSKAG